MENIKIEDISNIFRGYSFTKNNTTKDNNIGHEVYMINFSDIEDNKINYGEKVFLKNANFNTLDKYHVSAFDVLFPTTITTNLKVKCIQTSTKQLAEQNYKFPLGLYSQNVVVVRLTKPANNYMFYMPDMLTTLLNTKTMQNKLISQVYSNGKRTKGILINELRNLEIPYPTEELKNVLRMYQKEQDDFKKLLEKGKEKIEIAENRINNFI